MEAEFLVGVRPLVYRVVIYPRIRDGEDGVLVNGGVHRSSSDPERLACAIDAGSRAEREALLARIFLEFPEDIFERVSPSLTSVGVIQGRGLAPSAASLVTLMKRLWSQGAWPRGVTSAIMTDACRVAR